MRVFQSLEDTAAENSRLEREMMMLRQRLQTVMTENTGPETLRSQEVRVCVSRRGVIGVTSVTGATCVVSRVSRGGHEVGVGVLIVLVLCLLARNLYRVVSISSRVLAQER